MAKSLIKFCLSCEISTNLVTLSLCASDHTHEILMYLIFMCNLSRQLRFVLSVLGRGAGQRGGLPRVKVG